MFIEKLEDRSLLAGDWQNPVNRLDVDDSGLVTPLDALVVINAILQHGGRKLDAPAPGVAPPPFLDVNGNDFVEPLDALTVINYLNILPPEGFSFQKFHVDVTTGEVDVGPVSLNPADGSEGESRFIGSSVVFNSSQLVDQPGNAGLKVLNVSLTNQSGLDLGTLSNGTKTGLRVLFGPFTNVSASSDLRTKTTVTTVAGTGAASSVDGPATSASFFNPAGTVVDGGGTIYVTDSVGNRIRQISNGVVSTLAGSGVAGSANGIGTAASFNTPWGIARNPIDGALIVTDSAGQRVRRVEVDGRVTTIAGTGVAGDTNGAGSVATFRTPAGVAVDSNGAIYVVESDGQRVRKIVKTAGANPRLPTSYTVSVLAGSAASPPVAGFAEGIGAAARFNSPQGVAVDSSGNVYVVERINNRIRRVSPTGEVVTIAGTGVTGNVDGTGNVARFNLPRGIAVVDDSTLLVTDTGNNSVRQVTLRPGRAPGSANSWQVSRIAGTGAAGAAGGAGTIATFNAPRGIAVDSSRNAYVADFSNNRIRQLTPTNGFFPVGTPTGADPAEAVQLSNADGVIPLSNPFLGVIGSTGQMPFMHYPNVLATAQTSDVKGWSFIVPNGVAAFEFTVAVEANTKILAPPIGVSNPGPTGVGSPFNFVRTVAGRGLGGFVDGDALEAKFNGANGIAVDKFGNRYVADTNNHSIRRVAPDGSVTTVAGVVGKGAGSVDGNGTFAQFNGPRGVAVTDDGQTLYVTDSNNHTIRHIALTAADPTQPSSWTVSTIAGFAGDGTYADGPGGSARFNFPVGIAVTSSGIVYVSEFSGNRIRRLQNNGGDPSFNSSWIASLVAGSSVSPVGTAGNTNGFGTSARFDLPAHIAVDQAGNIYVADVNNSRIRKIDPDSNVSTLAGSTFGYHDDVVGTNAQFGQPNGVAVDSAGYVWVSDTSFHRIRRISPSGVVETVAGTGDTFPGDNDGTGNVARFYFPLGIDVDDSGSLHVVSGGTYQFDGGGGVTSPGLRIRLIERIFSVGESSVGEEDSGA